MSPSRKISLARTQRKNDRQPGIRFGFANASLKITAICFSHKARIVHEQDEFGSLEGRAPANPFPHFYFRRQLWRRRSPALYYATFFSPRLRGVKEFQSPAFHEWWRIGFKRLSQQTVQDPGADALPRRPLDCFDRCKNA